MNKLPKELEDIIIDFKFDLEYEDRVKEHKKKFNKTLKQIKPLCYFFIFKVNRGYITNFHMDFPIILKHYNSRYELNKLLTNVVCAKFKKEHEDIPLEHLFITRIEHEGYQVYRCDYTDRERLMTDEYLMDTVYENYK